MRKLIVGATLLAVPLGGWAAVDYYRDSRYEHRCINHASDIPLCYTGPAAEARRRCDRGERPPDTQPTLGTSACVRAWLAYEK